MGMEETKYVYQDYIKAEIIRRWADSCTTVEQLDNLQKFIVKNYPMHSDVQSTYFFIQEKRRSILGIHYPGISFLEGGTGYLNNHKLI